MKETIDPETILYGHEVDRWLGSFSGMNKEQCLEKIDAIWAKEGFVEPSELTKKLLISQLEPSPYQVYHENLIDNLLSTAHPRDQ